MGLFPNGGVTVASVTANGVAITGTVYMNGVAVWTGTTTQTDDPTSALASKAKRTLLPIEFFNTDASAVTILADISSSPPTTDRGIVQPGSSIVVNFTGLVTNTTYQFYFTAQASGETESNIVNDQYTTA